MKKDNYNSLYGLQVEKQILQDKNSDLDFELTLSIIVIVVVVAILVFTCCFASTRIIMLREEINDLKSNITSVE